MDIEVGNAGTIDTNGSGWVVGFGEWTKSGGPDLRYMNKHSLSYEVCVKWFDHKKDDPKGTGKPISEGRSMSFLVSEKGKFRVEFSEDKNFPTGQVTNHTLEKHGDFVIWGEGLYHRWFAEEASSILTVRWIPVLPPDA